MKPILYTAATLAALLVVLSTRLVVPALIILFRSIEAGFAPDEPAEDAVVIDGPHWYHALKDGVTAEELIASVEEEASEPLPVAVAEEPVPAPRKVRKARRRKPSAKTLAAIEAIA